MTEAPERIWAIPDAEDGWEKVYFELEALGMSGEAAYVPEDAQKAETTRLQNTIVRLARNALPEPGSEGEKAAVKRMARSICRDDGGRPDEFFMLPMGTVGRLWLMYEGPAKRALRALREGGE